MSAIPRATCLLDSDASGDAVIIKPSSLGDIVHTLPAVALLKQTWPSLRLHWVVNTEWAPLLAGSPLLESVIDFPRARFRGLAGLLRARRWVQAYEAGLRERSVVVALDFQGLLRSAWLARHSTAPVVVGLADAREGARHFYHAVAPTGAADGKPRHSVDRYLGLVETLGVVGDRAAVLSGDWLPAGVAPVGLPAGDIIVLHPFARGEGKSLGWAGAAALAAHWAGWPVVVVGRCDEPAPAGLPGHVINWVNQTDLPELIGVLRRARIVVSVDSGPMHLASALRRPLLGVHTWSDPRTVGPYDPAAWVWKAGRILRCHEVDSSLAKAHAAPAAVDLETIAAWVLEELGGGRRGIGDQ
jgi:heptosyltransferase-1